jgi:hypothetical protein
LAVYRYSVAWQSSAALPAVAVAATGEAAVMREVISFVAERARELDQTSLRTRFQSCGWRASWRDMFMIMAV